MNRIASAELTSEAFAHFGEVGAPLAGGQAAGEARGTPTSLLGPTVSTRRSATASAC
jgi:hypothetical protein